MPVTPSIGLASRAPDTPHAHPASGMPLCGCRAVGVTEAHEVMTFLRSTARTEQTTYVKDTMAALTGFIPTDENTADLFTKVLKRQPFQKHRKVVLNTGAGESTDEVKQQRVAALSAWKTRSVFYAKPQQSDKQASRLCLRGERAWGETLD